MAGITSPSTSDLMDMLLKIQSTVAGIPEIRQSVGKVQDSLGELTKSLEYTQGELDTAKVEIKNLHTKCAEIDPLKMEMQNLVG